jgi:hypothetical protein
MCIIIDADLASRVFCAPPVPDFRPILKWLMEKDGKMTYGGLNGRQLRHIKLARDTIRLLKQSGKALEIGGVDEEERCIRRQLSFKSNDSHIIALARKGGARVLCSSDRDLHKDFRNTQLVPSPKGKIYQNASHAEVLRHTQACRENCK